jgi:MFS transporter, OPA family, glycerol-3-phosphate transporter
MSSLPDWFREFLPILLLLVVVTVVFVRLPKVEVGHNADFLRRRVANWLPLGLTYAFLYMGRYNLKISKFAYEQMRDPTGGPMMSNEGFGVIFAVGVVVYGVSFIVNGPLTDRLGGKAAILAGGFGAAAANALMGLASWSLLHEGVGHGVIAAHFVVLFSLMYGLNMYFQSFGAVAIVKVNAPWFHVRERGVFGAIFGILISLGIYFAFGVGDLILKHLGLVWVFMMPALLLAGFSALDIVMVKNTPGEAGYQDFDTADASSGDHGPRLPATQVFKMMAKNPVIMTIATIEFCSGFLRQAIMQWFRTFAKQTDGALHLAGSFVYDNWGVLLCCAGILGGVVAGVISDHVFNSRRGPVAALLYFAMLAGAVVLTFTYTTPIVGWLVILMSMCVIGVHGMLSGTASMDFGGGKNVGTAVGIIDGFVYLGTGAMSITYALTLPEEQLDAAKHIVGPATNPANWISWPVAMIPMAVIGSLLAVRVWNAKPRPKEPADAALPGQDTAPAAKAA